MNLIALTATADPAESGGMTLQEVWDSLVYGLSWFFGNLSPAFAWAVMGIGVCVAFFVYYWHCLTPRPNSLEWITMTEERLKSWRLTLTLPCHPLRKGDALPILVITAVYAFTAFFQLGSFAVPQTSTAFQRGDTYEFSYHEPVTVDKVSYYTSLGSGAYALEWSEDGENWQGVTLDQAYNTLFKWQALDLNWVDHDGKIVEGDAQPVGTVTASYFRITATSAHRQEGVWLSELALWSGNTPLVPDEVGEGGGALFDESDLWETKATYMNSSYFDEIYHPRTALENLENVYPYEVSHPPLGKLIISLGIMIFGMVPFGWRFMGTLFGVLMVPILYIFLKNLFGKTPVAVCGTCLFTFDFMHLVQTRIATIDTYGVFFILVSYYFMYRWLAVPAGTKLRRSILPLFLSGLFWGIGCASKWTVVYAGMGLALLWLLGLIFKGREWYDLSRPVWQGGGEPPERPEPPKVPRFSIHVIGTVLLSVVFFVMIPLCIYTASYFPYASARGNEGGFGELAAQTLSWPAEKLPGYLEAAGDSEDGAIEGFFKAIPDSDHPVDIMLKNQYFMLTYHQGVHTPHPYESYWYQWIFDGRPILYYRDLDYYGSQGIKSLFASFNNPLVSWLGLAAFFAVVIQTVRRGDGKGLFILIAILSQFVPWLSIGRILFAYHYFPTVLFLTFAIAYLMNDMFRRRRRWSRLAMYGFTGCAVGLYALFYPALIGLYTPIWYNEYFLRWFPSWPL